MVPQILKENILKKLMFAMFILSTFALGCVKTVTIVPMDKNGASVDARIEVNGLPTGQGVTNVRVNGPINISVDGSPQYYSTNFTVNQSTSSPVNVALILDDIYALTVADTNQVINKWLTLNISEDAKLDNKWWTVIVNAISTQDFEMELMDQASGFIRSAWKERRFGVNAIRRRFVGNVVSTEPLQWRVKYQVQITNNYSTNAEWKDYDRGIKDELDVISEVRGRTQGDAN